MKRQTSAVVCATLFVLTLWMHEAGAARNRIPPPRDNNGLVKNCSHDVTAALQATIDATPDGGTISFEPGACYRIDGSVTVRDRTGLLFEGNGATFRAMSDGDRDRRHFWFFGGSDLTIRDMIVRGANPRGGVGSAAYRPDRAFQHAFALQGVEGALLERIQAYDVYGDFVYIGADTRVSGTKPWSKNVTIRQSRFERNGRQAISVVAGEDIAILNNRIGDVRWSMFDLEPNGPQGGARHVLIAGNRTGRGRLLWLASKGRGSHVDHITVRDNVMEDWTGTPVISITAPLGGTRGPFTVENNSFRIGGSPKAGLEFIGCEQVTVRENFATLPKERGMTAVRFEHSTLGIVAANTFIGAAQTVNSSNSLGVVDLANSTSG